MVDKLLTSQEWHNKIIAIYPDFYVMDPDGWDRNNYEQSWGEPITFEEFEYRATSSTCCWPRAMIDLAVSGIDPFKELR